MLTPSQYRNTDVFLSKEELRVEIQKEVKKLTFPEGFVWPEHILDRDPDDMEYQQGIEATTALQVAFCAWGREALKHRQTEPDLSQAALAEYEKLTKSETVRRYYDESAVATDSERVQSAKLGDWAAMQFEVEDQCAFYFTNDPSAFDDTEDD